MTRPRGTHSAIRQGLITLFILCHLVAIWMQMMPPSALQRRVVPRVVPYLRFTGLIQAWNIFAPEPGHGNIYLEARITYADGSTRVWPFGRQDHRRFWDRTINARAHRLAEYVWDAQRRGRFYPQIALWAAHVNTLDPANPPVQVDIWRAWAMTPPLPQGLRQNPIAQWRQVKAYTKVFSPPRAP